MLLARKDFWDTVYRAVSDYPLGTKYYAIPLGEEVNVPLPTSIDHLEWEKHIEKLAWDIAKIPAQLYVGSNRPQLYLESAVEGEVIPVLVVSGPDYKSTAKEREDIARALGTDPKGIKRVYLVVLPWSNNL